MESLMFLNLLSIFLIFFNICTATIYDEQDNPDVWPNLCQIGKIQSPINLVEKEVLISNGSEVKFNLKDYDKGIGFIKLYNDGKSIFVTLINERIRPTVVFNNTNYQMIQFHFHWHASEHAINGVLYDGEIHLVHQDPVTQKLLVLGALLKKTFYSNNIISRIFQHSLKTITKYQTSSYLYIKPNFRQLLDNINLRKYLTYEGSLTTPGCGEGVRWIVFRELIKVDRLLLDGLSQRFEDKEGEILKFNNRKLQERNDREIYKTYKRAYQFKFPRMRNEIFTDY